MKNYKFQTKNIIEELTLICLYGERTNNQCTHATVNTCPITNTNCSCKK